MKTQVEMYHKVSTSQLRYTRKLSLQKSHAKSYNIAAHSDKIFIKTNN